MPEPRQAVLDYLRSPADAFWRWADEGRVIIWFDGATIAFREEVESALHWLSPGGLPPFGSIVLLMAACRGKIPDSSLFIAPPQKTANENGKEFILMTGERNQLQTQLDSAIHQLRRVSGFSRDLMASPNAKLILAEVVFEQARVERLNLVLTGEVIRGLQEPMADGELNEPVSSESKTNHVRHLHLVAQGLKPHDEAALALRIKAGLDETPAAADVDLAPAERAAKLLAELKNDEEWGGLMRVTRDLMAALQLPRALSELDSQALGGVSDITNRGPLDRLLLSELAHDDLTLAARVALNEALFLRREPPVRRPETRLTVMLDGSVRAWGIPRVLSAAVGLAAIARARSHTEAAAFRLSGAKAEPVDLLTRRGLEEYFSKLEPSEHPGAALEMYFSSSAPVEKEDVILVTQKEVAQDSRFRRSLARLEGAPLFMATVDRDGSFALLRAPFTENSIIASAVIDIEKLFQSESARSAASGGKGSNLPVILETRPFPFMLPLHRNLERVLRLSNGETAGLTDNHSLLCWKANNRGGRLVATGLPPGRALWLGEAKPGMAGLLTSHWENGSVPLALIDLETGQAQRFALSTRLPPSAVQQEGSAILFLHATRCEVFSLNTGQILAAGEAPQARWVRGRYYKSAHDWYFPMWDGLSLSFHPVTLPAGVLPDSIAVMFDRHQVEGPWALSVNGEIRSLNDGKLARVKFDGGALPKQITLSEDGHRIAKMGTGKVSPMINLETMTRHDFSPQYMSQVLAATPKPETRNIRRRFSAVYFHEGAPCLLSSKGTWVTPEITPTSLVLQFCQPPRAGTEPVKFTPHCSNLQEERVLEVAEMAHGWVFLDYRGMLHLKSADCSQPEISIVLVEGNVAVWSSDGLIYGSKYFVEERANCSALKIFQRIKSVGKSLA